VPGERVGLVMNSTTESELKTVLKSGEYKRALVDIGEGTCHFGAVLYPGTQKEISLVWRSRDAEVDCTGEAGQTNAALEHHSPFSAVDSVRVESPAWHTAQGVKTGLNIPQLQKINGHAFLYSGFDWDYGGRVTSWEKGVLPDNLSVVLKYDDAAENIPLGEEQVRSDSQAISAENIRIQTIQVEF
jgi:hypothetical protein